MPMLSLVVVIFIIVHNVDIEISIRVYVVIVAHQRRIAKGKAVPFDAVETTLAHINVFTSG